MDLVPGLRASAEHLVTEADTAVALGSGDVPVLATPRLLAWAEAVTVATLAGHLEPAATSVGVHVQLEHLAASAVGATVVVAAELVDVEGRRLRFTVAAREGEREVARGEVRRAVVERGRFLERLSSKP